MKTSLINYFFESKEEYETYKPYIKALEITAIVSILATILIRIA